MAEIVNSTTTTTTDNQLPTTDNRQPTTTTMGSNKRRRKHKDKKSPSDCNHGDHTSATNEVNAVIENSIDDGAIVHVEQPTNDSDHVDIKQRYVIVPDPWKQDMVEKIDAKSARQNMRRFHRSEETTGNIMEEIGKFIVKGALDRIDKKRKKNYAAETAAASCSHGNGVKATPIQLHMWPTLLHFFESSYMNRNIDTTTNDKDRSKKLHARANIVGIACTGSGKTLSYAIPLVSLCFRNLLSLNNDKKFTKVKSESSRKLFTSSSTTSCKSSMNAKNVEVHGLILTPTRELAIQVAKECNLAAKVANKIFSSQCNHDGGENDVKGKVEKGGTKKIERKSAVEAIAIYGGVDIHLQLAQLGFISVDKIEVEGETKWKPSSNRNIGSEYDSECYRSLIVASTPGRLLDLLKSEVKIDDATDGKECSVVKVKVSTAFANIQAVVFDEADRIAVNNEMAGQVDEILDIIHSVRSMRDVISNNHDAGGDGGGGNGIVSCLVSATLSEKSKEVCDKWVPCPRVVIKVDSVKVGGGMQRKEGTSGESGRNTDEITAAGDTATASTADAETPFNEEMNENEDDNLERDKRNKKQKVSGNLDLASIPSHLVQTLHVCSNHKKPRKLITTLQRIYSKKGNMSDRSSTTRHLCIVFFAQIKTVKYAGKLLQKEGLRYVELHGKLNQSEREARLLEFKC
ncbi:hypothetical protein ACHAXS_008641, partial [Conticribra weissflogii]